MALPRPLQSVVGLGRDTISDWLEDRAPRLGAALAFYAVLSLAPFLVIAVGIVGIVYGEGALHEVEAQFTALVGAEAGRAIAEIAEQSGGPTGGWIASAIGLATLLFGASGVFGELQDALNTIWEVKPRPDRGWLGVLRDRFFSFTMVLGTGFLLLVSLVLSAALAALGSWAGSVLPGGEALWGVVHALVSFGLVTLLFALIYQVVPDAEIAWRDAFVGGAATAVLFVAGKLAIGLYLGQSTLSSAYGAAGTLLVLLVWIYYSAQILFLGAEFTQVYANRRGAGIAPARGAVPTGETTRETARPRERSGTDVASPAHPSAIRQESRS